MVPRSTTGKRRQPDLGADAGADAAPGVGVGGVGRDPRALPPGSLSITHDSSGGRYRGLGRGRRQRPGLRARRLAIHRRHCARRDLEGIARRARRGEELDGLRHDLRRRHALPGERLRRSSNPGRARRNRRRYRGNVWGAANERNAIVVVTPQGGVREVFRNPPNVTSRLRNEGPLEFPTSSLLARQKAVRHSIRHQPPRQLSQTAGARSDRCHRTLARQGLVHRPALAERGPAPAPALADLREPGDEQRRRELDHGAAHALRSGQRVELAQGEVEGIPRRRRSQRRSLTGTR